MDGAGRPARARARRGHPCGDWDLRTLLNHTILWTAYSAERRARDEPLPEEWMTRDFVGEPGYAAAYAAQIDRAWTPGRTPKAWQRDLNVMGSPTPAADVAALLLAETVLHGWDVAKASGQEFSCAENVAAATASAVAANAELFRKYQGFADRCGSPRRPRSSTGSWPTPGATRPGSRPPDRANGFARAPRPAGTHRPG